MKSWFPELRQTWPKRTKSSYCLFLQQKWSSTENAVRWWSLRHRPRHLSPNVSMVKSGKSCILSCHSDGSFQRIPSYVGSCFLRSSDRHQEREKSSFRFSEKIDYGRFCNVSVFNVHEALRQYWKCECSYQKGESIFTAARLCRYFVHYGQAVRFDGIVFWEKGETGANRGYSTGIVLRERCSYKKKIRPLSPDFLFLTITAIN